MATNSNMENTNTIPAVIEIVGVDASSSKAVMDEVFISEIENFFQSDLDIKNIIKFSDPNEQLKPAQQNTLARRTILFMLNRNENRRISTSEFLLLRKAIIRNFPNECEGTYYSPGKKCKTGRVPITGKLWNNYCYSNKGKTQSKSPNVSNAPVNVSTDEDAAEDCLTWLKSNTSPFDVVKLKWQKTYAQRSEILKNSASINEYSLIFPCLKSPEANELVKIDFDLLMKTNASDNFENNFAKVFDKLKQILSNTKFKNVEVRAQAISLNTINEGSCEGLIFSLLAHLIPPTYVNINKRTNTGEKKKPSAQEISDALYIHVVNSTDIQHKIDQRRSYYSKVGLTLQPTILFVGPTLTNLDTYYVIVDQLRFHCGNFKEALQVCFNLFFVFNAEYPAEARQQWVFLQRVLFEIQNDDDRPSIALQNFLGQFKKL